MQDELFQPDKEVNYLLWCLNSSENIGHTIDSLSDQQILKIHQQVCNMSNLRKKRIKSTLMRGKSIAQKFFIQISSIEKLETEYPESGRHMVLLKSLEKLKKGYEKRVESIIAIAASQSSIPKHPFG
jgi:hypothetical protein